MEQINQSSSNTANTDYNSSNRQKKYSVESNNLKEKEYQEQQNAKDKPSLEIQTTQLCETNLVSQQQRQKTPLIPKQKNKKKYSKNDISIKSPTSNQNSSNMAFQIIRNQVNNKKIRKFSESFYKTRSPEIKSKSKFSTEFQFDEVNSTGKCAKYEKNSALSISSKKQKKFDQDSNISEFSCELGSLKMAQQNLNTPKTDNKGNDVNSFMLQLMSKSQDFAFSSKKDQDLNQTVLQQQSLPTEDDPINFIIDIGKKNKEIENKYPQRDLSPTYNLPTSPHSQQLIQQIFGSKQQILQDPLLKQTEKSKSIKQENEELKNLIENQEQYQNKQQQQLDNSSQSNLNINLSQLNINDSPLMVKNEQQLQQQSHQFAQYQQQNYAEMSPKQYEVYIWQIYEAICKQDQITTQQKDQLKGQYQKMIKQQQQFYNFHQKEKEQISKLQCQQQFQSQNFPNQYQIQQYEQYQQFYKQNMQNFGSFSQNINQANINIQNIQQQYLQFNNYFQNQYQQQLNQLGGGSFCNQNQNLYQSDIQPEFNHVPYFHSPNKDFHHNQQEIENLNVTELENNHPFLNQIYYQDQNLQKASFGSFGYNPNINNTVTSRSGSYSMIGAFAMPNRTNSNFSAEEIDKENAQENFIISQEQQREENQKMKLINNPIVIDFLRDEKDESFQNDF